MATMLGPLLHIEAGGSDFAYRRFHFGYLRDQTPLVLLPGLGSTMSEWTPQFLQLLAHRREVIILDYLGQGLTQELAPSDGPITTQQLADSCLAFVEALELEIPNVLGFCLGAAVLLHMLAQAPQRLGKAILLGGYTPDKHFVAGPAESSAAWLRPDATVAERSELFFPTDTDAGAAAASTWVHGVNEMPGDPPNPATTTRVLAAFGPALKGSLEWRPAPALGNPVLLMAGGQDKLVPPANAQHLQSRIPGSSLVVFPEGGHGFFWQAPNKAAAYINAFLMPDE